MLPNLTSVGRYVRLKNMLSQRWTYHECVDQSGVDRMFFYFGSDKQLD
jgi:hypothetical protein